MSTIKIDVDGNFELVNNSLQITEGTDTIDQTLRHRLRTFKGEYFLDINTGIAYYQEILKKNPNSVIIDTIFKREILNTDGVVELLEFSIDISSARELTLTFRASTTDGSEINFSETVI